MNKREMMDQVDCISSKLVGNNTIEYMDYSGNRIIRHFHTDVLIFAPNGSIVFNTNGHKSKTTKERINNLQDHVNIWQENRVWYVASKELSFWNMSKEERQLNTYIYADGMRWWTHRPAMVECVPCGSGWLSGTGQLPDKQLIKNIRAYAKAFATSLPVEPPGSGDCFICQSDGSSCLQLHMEERYFVPRLLYNAMVEAGAGRAWFASAFYPNQLIRLDRSSRAQYAKWIVQYMYRRLIDGQSDSRLPTTGFSI